LTLALPTTSSPSKDAGQIDSPSKGKKKEKEIIKWPEQCKSCNLISSQRILIVQSMPTSELEYGVPIAHNMRPSSRSRTDFSFQHLRHIMPHSPRLAIHSVTYPNLPLSTRPPFPIDLLHLPGHGPEMAKNGD
jgi:hypothetical protein